LEGLGVKIYIHNNPSGNIQPIRIRYGFEAVVGRDFFDVHNEFLNFISLLGFKVSREVVSNVEMQVMVNRDVAEFLSLIMNNFCVRSFYKCSWFTDSSGNLSGIRGGVGIKLRIYNKTQELLDTRAELKSSLLSRYCTGGVIPSNLTRIEFSLGRDFLNDSNIDSVADLRLVENSLIRYLTYDWFRLLVNEKSRGNASRQQVHPIWCEVQDLFNEYFPGGDKTRKFVRSSSVMKGINCDPKILKAQAIGCLCSAIAVSCGDYSTKDSVKSYLLSLFDENADLIMKKIEFRRVRNRVVSGFEPSDVGSISVYDSCDFDLTNIKKVLGAKVES
jgi:hypothetical protein